MILAAPQLWTPRRWRLPRWLGELAAMAGGHLCIGSGGHLKLGTGGHLTTNCGTGSPCLSCSAGVPLVASVALSGISLIGCCGTRNFYGSAPSGVYDLHQTVGCNWSGIFPFTGMFWDDYPSSGCTGGLIRTTTSDHVSLGVSAQAGGFAISVSVLAASDSGSAKAPFNGFLTIPFPTDCFATRTFTNNNATSPCSTTAPGTGGSATVTFS